MIIFLDKLDLKKKIIHSGKAFPFLPAFLIFLFIQHIFAINLHGLYYPPANGYYQESLFSFPVPGPFYLNNSGSFWRPPFQPFNSAPHFTNFSPYPPFFESAPDGMVFPIQPFLRWPYSNQQPFPYLRSSGNFSAFPGSMVYQPQPSEDLIMIYPARYPFSLTNYPYKEIFTPKPETSSPVSSHLKRPEKLSEYPIPANTSQAKKTVLRQALDWIFDNPVDLRNKNIVEIGEEILLFYQLYRRTGTQEAEDLCLEYITDQIKEIINLGIFDSPTSGNISVFLRIFEIMDKLDLSLFDYHSFINQNILYNPGTYSSPLSLWNSYLLEVLGFYPLTPLTISISQAAIMEEFTSNQLMQLMDQPQADGTVIMNRFYDITHEIFPLADFGDRSIESLSPQQIFFLENLVAKGINYFVEEFPDVDILGELIVCASILDLDDQELLDAATQFIMDQQTADGSFGELPRMTAIGRSSASRHPAFMSVWALIQ